MLYQMLALCQTNTDIYIKMDDRKELRLAPKIDTLINKEDYTYKLTIDPQYRFAELYCDRGLAVKFDNFLRITPNSSKKGALDTLTLRIILFSATNRILFYKHIYIKTDAKVYEQAIRKQTELIYFNNLALERNMTYKRNNFREKGVFFFWVPDKVRDEDKKVISMTISMVNRQYNKSFFVKGSQLSQEVYNEMRKQKIPTQTYIRLDVRIGKKIRSIWTRFTMA
jgi:hypothetical protein